MPFTLQFRLAVVLLVAECLNVAQVAEGVQEFKRCYNNTSKEESHCFDVQYYADNQPLHTSFPNANTSCRDLNSTLVIIENEEIHHLIQQFMNDTSNPIGKQYFWLNAYRVNEFSNPYRWHWLNTTLPNLPGSAVSYTYNSDYYTAVLEFRNDKSQFVLTAKQPQSTFYYVCEYSVSNCSSMSSSSSNDVRLMNGRCYREVQEWATWYEARKRCLTGGGDLASFANVTSINFTSWLRSQSDTRYWIGLRFIWYTWGDSGQELNSMNWAKNGDDWNSPCLIFCFNCDPPFTWSPRDCGTWNSIYVVCHTITSLKTTTSTTETISMTQTTNLPTTMSNFTTETFARKEESPASSIIPVAVGVGVGVGVPVIVGIVVITIFIVRKRRHETVSSAQSTNRHQRETSIDQPFEAQTENERDEIGETAYGTVVPSALSRQAAAEANGAHSATDQTVYAPLQIL